MGNCSNHDWVIPQSGQSVQFVTHHFQLFDQIQPIVMYGCGDMHACVLPQACRHVYWHEHAVGGLYFTRGLCVVLGGLL